METPQQKFLKRLEVLANLTGATLTKDIVALYDRGLRSLGYDALCGAVEEVIKTRRSRDPFPSIADIAKILRPREEDRDLAIEAAGRVIQAIGKFGTYQADEARQWIGEIGWYVVERAGGWSTLCARPESEREICRAQYRDLALSAINRHKAGTLNLPPAFSHVAVQSGKNVAALTAGIGKSVNGGKHGIENHQGVAAGVPVTPSGVVESNQGGVEKPRPLPGVLSSGTGGQGDASKAPRDPGAHGDSGAAQVPG